MPTQSRSHWLTATVAFGCAASLLLSPKLWLTTRLYPLTPVSPIFVPFHPPYDSIAYFALIAALLLAAILPRPRVPIAAFAVIAVTLALQDQSRWQPWFYQYLLMLLAIGIAGDGKKQSAFNTCRLIVVAIYIWSGISKLNPAFANSTLPSMAETLTKSQAFSHAAAVFIPLLEIALGCGLLTKKFRKAALITAIAMHVFILATIGPLGQRHNSVVWPWNLAMIAFVTILFNNREAALPGDIVWGSHFAFHKVVLLLVGIAPVLSVVNRWDSYLSFALYSGNSNSADIFMSDTSFAELPDTLQNYVYDVSPNLNRLSINEWSYGELNVPPYPERRIFANVAGRICSLTANASDVKLVTQMKFGLADSNRSYSEGCQSLTAESQSPP